MTNIQTLSNVYHYIFIWWQEGGGEGGGDQTDVKGYHRLKYNPSSAQDKFPFLE